MQASSAPARLLHLKPWVQAGRASGPVWSPSMSIRTSVASGRGQGVIVLSGQTHKQHKRVEAATTAAPPVVEVGCYVTAAPPSRR